MPNAGIVELLLIVLIVVVVIAIAYVVIVLVARTLHRFLPATTPPRDPALDVLRSRFASGEIDEPEYERLRSALQRH